MDKVQLFRMSTGLNSIMSCKIKRFGPVKNELPTRNSFLKYSDFPNEFLYKKRSRSPFSLIFETSLKSS